MAPSDVKKGSPKKKQRLIGSLDVRSDIFSEFVQKTKWALIGPRTGLGCKCCFSIIADINQHIASKSACAVYIASNHIEYCQQENGTVEIHYDIVIVACMLQDPDCIVNAKDITNQPGTWDPSSNFICTGEFGHRLSDELKATTFQALYEDYVQKNPTLVLGDVPDISSQACQKATSIKNLNKNLKDAWLRAATKFASKYVKKKVTEGEFIRREHFQVDLDKIVEARDLVPRNDLDKLVDERVQAELDRKIQEHVAAEIAAGRLIRPTADN